MKKIVITGPESTGKSSLTERLASDLQAAMIPEYARVYVENLGRPYTRADVEAIARHQIQEVAKWEARQAEGLLIMDTWLIMTKVWLEVVYGTSPEWLTDHIRSSQVHLFLICRPDLPWVADPVRENGGEMRQILFDRYCNEIASFGFLSEEVSGIGEERVACARTHLRKHGLIGSFKRK
ncbi:MAG: ATP-binding protein [Marinilabiliales bacterium]|nr:ATP-binding protein [Marinilabiliales bacterium]